MGGGRERHEEETPSERKKEGDGKHLSRIEGEGSEQGTALRLCLWEESGDVEEMRAKNSYQRREHPKGALQRGVIEMCRLLGAGAAKGVLCADTAVCPGAGVCVDTVASPDTVVCSYTVCFPLRTLGCLIFKNQKAGLGNPSKSRIAL